MIKCCKKCSITCPSCGGSMEYTCFGNCGEVQKYYTEINDSNKKLCAKLAQTPCIVEPPGIGLSKYWKLPDSHEFYIPAVKHDCRYSMRICGLLDGPLFKTSEHADEMFNNDCNKIIDSIPDDWGIDRHDWLEGERVICYGSVRLVGSVRWPEPSKNLEEVKAEMANIFRCLDILKAAGETNVSLTMFQNIESI